jgi:pimeloyl-ACP methyl ester carboxylesterase
VLLVHGGAGPELTWREQEPLSARWRLIVPWRRGFEPSPASDRQDFEVDADDVEALLTEEGGGHLVGFSYGGLGAALVAGRSPELVHSLTLIEVPLFALAPDQPDVKRLMRLAATAIDPAVEDDDARRTFFELAGLSSPEHAAERERAERLSRGLRPPIDCEPDYDVIAGELPSLVVSGRHQASIEAISDAIAARIGARREHLPGGGHAVQRVPGFNDVLEAFMLSTVSR